MNAVLSKRTLHANVGVIPEDRVTDGCVERAKACGLGNRDGIERITRAGAPVRVTIYAGIHRFDFIVDQSAVNAGDRRVEDRGCNGIRRFRLRALKKCTDTSVYLR